MTIYELRHSHRHGCDSFLFKSELSPDDISCEDIATDMGVCYEQERGEELELKIIDLSMIHEYKKGD